MRRWPREVDTKRGVSPVIGVVLLVAIVAILAGSIAFFVFGFADSPQPAPETRFEFEYDTNANAVTITHDGGETISSENTGRLLVVVDSGAETDEQTWAEQGAGVADLDASDLTLGDQITVDDETGSATGDRTLSLTLERGDTVTVVWESPSGDRTTELDSDTVPDLGDVATTSILDDSKTVVTGDTAVNGDSGQRVTVGPSGAQALGSLGDADSDGTAELPYVDGSGDLKLNDSDGQTQTLLDAGSVSATKAPDTDTTRMAVTTWNGTGPAVFYVNANENAIYRVRNGATPTEVTDLSGNGANSVLGTGDIDGDGDAELVYAGGSQTVRYVESDGTKKTTGFSSGSNVGIGSGPVTDLDGDGTDEAVAVGGGNEIHLVDAGGSETKLAAGSVSAEKSPVTVTDVDGDADSEVLFVKSGSPHEVAYVDDPLGANTIKPLTDDGGSTITGDRATGLIS